MLTLSTAAAGGNNNLDQLRERNPELPFILNAHSGGRTLRQPQIDWFLRKQVPVLALATPWQVLFDDVVFDADGYSFRFARDCDGEIATAALTVVIETASGPVDILAWTFGPQRLATWLGRAFALGEAEIYAPNLTGDPLPVWRTPMGWLRSGREGIVPLPVHPIRKNLVWKMIDHVPGVVAEDVEHGRELRRHLRKQRRCISVFVRGSNQGKVA